jgi:hypothetical protein
MSVLGQKDRHSLVITADWKQAIQLKPNGRFVLKADVHAQIKRPRYLAGVRLFYRLIFLMLAMTTCFITMAMLTSCFISSVQPFQFSVS